MANKQPAISCVVVTVILAGFAWLVLRPHELAFEGQPLSGVLQDLYAKGRYVNYSSGAWGLYPGPAKLQAERAVRTLGTNALPLLLRWAGTGFSGFRNVVGIMARNPPFDYLHLPPQEGKHELAAWAFKLLGPDARPAVPALVRLLHAREPEVRISAAACLAGIGPAAREAVPDLIKLLPAGNGSTWRSAGVPAAAARALGEIGPAASAAIPYLAESTNEVMQIALIKIRQDSFLPFFERLKDTSDYVKWTHAVMEVSRLGANADPAIPFLVGALAHTNNLIQNRALFALGDLQRRPEVCLPALRALLKSTNATLRANSLHVLAAFGPAAKPAAPEIVVCLSDRESWVRDRATNALRAIDAAGAGRAGIK